MGYRRTQPRCGVVVSLGLASCLCALFLALSRTAAAIQ